MIWRLPALENSSGPLGEVRVSRPGSKAPFSSIGGDQSKERISHPDTRLSRLEIAMKSAKDLSNDSQNNNCVTS